MRPGLGALGLAVLLAGLPDCASAGHERDLAAPVATEGEIALTDTPFCPFFVVHTDRGFSLLRWRGEMEIFAEGDRVRGVLHATGLQQIELLLEPKLLAAVGPSFTLAEIERSAVDLSEAQAAYFRACFPERQALGLKAVSSR